MGVKRYCNVVRESAHEAGGRFDAGVYYWRLDWTCSCGEREGGSAVTVVIFAL